MDKKALRKYIREKKSAMTQAEIENASRGLCDRFLETEQYRHAKTVYGYLPYNQEVRTTPILERALLDGKRIAIPKIYGDEMKFIFISDLSQVELGYKGIPEPIADIPVADDPTALILMPGVAFDKQGHRIGYGGGFYDKFLEKEPEHPTVALCYGFQMMDSLETEEYDIPVDCVLCAEG